MSYFEKRRKDDTEILRHECRPPRWNPFRWRFDDGAIWVCTAPLTRDLKVRCRKYWYYRPGNKGHMIWWDHPSRAIPKEPWDGRYPN